MKKLFKRGIALFLATALAMSLMAGTVSAVGTARGSIGEPTNQTTTGGKGTALKKYNTEPLTGVALKKAEDEYLKKSEEIMNIYVDSVLDLMDKYGDNDMDLYDTTKSKAEMIETMAAYEELIKILETFVKDMAALEAPGKYAELQGLFKAARRDTTSACKVYRSALNTKTGKVNYELLEQGDDLWYDAVDSIDVAYAAYFNLIWYY